MKKIIVAVMVLSMVIGLSACGLINSSSTETSSVDQSIESSDTLSSEATSSTSTSAGSWAKEFYVDEFNEPTDEWYAYYNFSGTFSNSATNNSKLSGYVLVDNADVCFVLYEYGRNQVKNIYSDAEEYTIVARSDSGEQTFTGYVYSEGDRLAVAESSVGKMKELLKSGGTIKFYIYETDNSVTNYLFQVESDNLKDLIG